MSYEQDLVKRVNEKMNEFEKTVVRIALVGQPGAGKSSLINAILGEKVFKVSPETDTTKKAESHTFGKMFITDLPGYGTSMFPVQQWVEQFKVYDYDLYLFTFSGKLTQADSELFKYLEQWRNEREHPYFVVRNKCDAIWEDGKTEEELRDIIIKDVAEKSKLPNLKVYFTSCKTKEGIDELSSAIANCEISDVKKGKLLSELRATCIADLNAKKKAAMDIVDRYATAAAVNGLNPIPGTDAAIDIATIIKMTSEIRDVFDLEDKSIAEEYGPILTTAGKQAMDVIFDFAGKEAIIKALQKYATAYIGKSATKYIPFLGQIISCTVSYFVAHKLGEMYVDNCYTVAKEILEHKLKDAKQ